MPCLVTQGEVQADEHARLKISIMTSVQVVLGRKSSKRSRLVRIFIYLVLKALPGLVRFGLCKFGRIRL